MTNKEAAELLKGIADRREVMIVEGQEKRVRPDDTNEALRLAVKALTVDCSVCMARFYVVSRKLF